MTSNIYISEKEKITLRTTNGKTEIQHKNGNWVDISYIVKETLKAISDYNKSKLQDF